MEATLTRQQSTAKDRYLAAIARLNAAVGMDEPVWLARVRNRAAQTFQQMSFPTTKDEDWKYTSVAPILRVPFAPALDPLAESISSAEVARLAAGGPDASRLVFVNGHYAPALSIQSRTSAVVTSLADALSTHREVVAEHLGQYVAPESSAFAALNTALLQDGALVYVPSGLILDETLHLLFLSMAGEEPVVSHPRVLVVLDPGSTATLAETYVSLATGGRFTNAVAEIVLGEGAHLEHYRIVEEGRQAFHVQMTEVHQSRDSVYASLNVHAGAAIGRNDLRVRLTGPGASCDLDGVSVSQGDEHVDNHTLIDHASSHGASRQLYKGILDDRSRTVFNGRIIVRPGAQRTDARQANRNLLLSTDAILDTKPQLEILADDVKCTHGATVGQLDDDMVFYLRSRGLDEEAARGILTYGFASEMIASVRDAAVRSHLDRLLAARLSGGAPAGLGEAWAETIGRQRDVV